MDVMKWTSVLPVLFFSSFSAAAWGEERLVYADVERVVPITERASHLDIERCVTQRPQHHASLAETLRWDLSDACRVQTRSITQGYTVHYRWGNRRYTHRMKQHPGERLPIRVQVEHLLD